MKLITARSAIFLLGIVTAIPASASHGPGAIGFEPGEVVRYRCEGSMSLIAQYANLWGTPAVEITVIDRSNASESGHDGRFVMVAGPTGSGVRYSNGSAVFHMKGDEARLDAPEGAHGPAIEIPDCRKIAPDTLEPMTQGAQAGTYFVAPERHARAEHRYFVEAETICFAKGQPAYFALAPGAGETGPLVYTEREVNPVSVGEVDAGTGTRRYPLARRSDPDMPIHLTFSAPGMVEGTLKATSGLSSVSNVQGERRECIDDGNFAYVGASRTSRVTISLEEDGSLTYREGVDPDAPERIIENGFVSRDLIGTTFHFFGADGAHARVSTNDRGASLPNAWAYTINGMGTEEHPFAYFLANPELLLERAQTLPSSTVETIQQLEICNHLAGEVGDSASRNQQVAASWAKEDCDGVVRQHAILLENQELPGTLMRWLVANAPNWI